MNIRYSCKIKVLFWYLIYYSTDFQLPVQSVYHNKCCEFEPHSGEMYSIQRYVIKFKFVSDLRRSVVFSGYTGFLHQKNWPPWYNWNIAESGVKGNRSQKKYFLIYFSWCINMDVYMYISVLLCWMKEWNRF
jgi:hypothetical protein